MKQYVVCSKMMNCPDEVLRFIYKSRRQAQAKADYMNTHDVIGETYWVREIDLSGIFYTRQGIDNVK